MLFLRKQLIYQEIHEASDGKKYLLRKRCICGAFLLHNFFPLLIASTKGYKKEGRKIDDYIIRRALEVGQYIAETGATVRQAAKKFGVSKSSVHKDMDKRLSEISPGLFFEVQQVLKYNKAVRHLRGGAATRLKYALARRTQPDLARKKEFTQQM